VPLTLELTKHKILLLFGLDDFMEKYLKKNYIYSKIHLEKLNFFECCKNVKSGLHAQTFSEYFHCNQKVQQHVVRS
jgi:hypothetical protein